MFPFYQAARGRAPARSRARKFRERSATHYAPNHPLTNLTAVLEEFHTTAPVQLTDSPPHMIVNVLGQERRAVPTLVSFPNTHALRPSGNRPGLGL